MQQTSLVGTWHVIFCKTFKSAGALFLIINKMLRKNKKSYNSAHKMTETFENS